MSAALLPCRRPSASGPPRGAGWTWRTLGVLLLVSSAACGAREAAPPSVSRADSAGIEIVTSVAPLEAEGLALADLPDLEIGVQQGDEALLLDGVVGAARLPDGAVLLCNAGDRTLRFYEPDGAHRMTAAGEGGGPGELRLLNRCFLDGDEVRVFQAPRQPVQRYGLDGAFLGSEPVPLVDGAPALLLEALPGGVFVQHRVQPLRDAPPGISDQLTTLYLNAGGEVESLGSVPFRRLLRHDRAFFPQSFAPALRSTVLGRGFALGWSETFDVGLYDADGALQRRIRRPVEPLAVAGAWVGDWETAVLDAPPGGADWAVTPEQVVEMMVHPDRLPAHYRLLSDAADRIWVERADGPRTDVPWVRSTYAGPTTWDVFDPSGAWLTSVVLPTSFDPLEIGVDYVLGVHRDDLGVERVRSYRLQG